MHWEIALAVVLLLALILFAAWRYLLHVPLPIEPKLHGLVAKEALRVGDRERTFVAYLPAQLPKNAPLVIVLHGSGLDGSRMRGCTGYEFDLLADERKLAVVYPDGYKGHFNDTRRAARFPAKLENIDDVGFLKALIAWFVERHGVDAHRVYAFGYSNGAHMALRLALDEPMLLVGIAAVCATLPVPDNNLCAKDGPTPKIMLINGTHDPISPFRGGEVTLFGFSSRGFVIPVAKTVEDLLRRNGITEVATTVTLPHLDRRDTTSVERREWKQAHRPRIVDYVIHGGGHVIPQPVFRFPRLMGKMTKDLDSPLAAIDFFLEGDAPRTSSSSRAAASPALR